jgi:predicted nucleic acid-binding protein
MPLNFADIVVDTNVFVHSHNPSDRHFPSSVAFLAALRGSETALCFDSDASPNEASNRSRILAEYQLRLPSHSLAAKIVTEILQSVDRWRSVSAGVPSDTRSVINHSVVDPRDRLFVRTCVNTDEKVLVSHDYRAYTADCCRILERRCGVKVLDAESALT